MPIPKRIKKPSIDNVKASIPAGDTSMADGLAYTAEGAGVVEKVNFVGPDQNDDVTRNPIFDNSDGHTQV